MSWEEEDWVDEEAVADRGPDEFDLSPKKVPQLGVDLVESADRSSDVVSRDDEYSDIEKLTYREHPRFARPVELLEQLHELAVERGEIEA